MPQLHTKHNRQLPNCTMPGGTSSSDLSTSTSHDVRRHWILLAVVLVLPVLTGCQSSRVRWNLFNWQNLDRVPPPSTGSLSIPGVNSAGYPTSNLPAPPATLPNGTSLPNVNLQGQGSGQLNPGVYFNQGSTQSGQWQNSAANPAGNALSAIPGRDASATAGWPPTNQPSVGAVATGGSSVPLATNVPSRLTADNFDPFATDRIPSWNQNILAEAGTQSNPLMVTSPTGNTSGNSQTGWWPNQSSYNAQASYNNGGIGNGQLLKSMQQSVKNVFQMQPANMGGFQTTTPIDNPMILATGYNANAQVAGQAGNVGNGAAQLPPQAANLANPTLAQAASNANGQLASQQAAAQQWAEMQQRQMDLLRAQQMQQLQAQAAVNPNIGVGTGPMQVLAVNTTSEIAEQQSRMGLRTAAGQNVDPRYAGHLPQGGAAIAPVSTVR